MTTIVQLISQSPIKYSRSKYIDIKHHFIRDHVQKGNIELRFINIENQIADIFTKPLAEDHFYHIKNILNMTIF